MGTLITINRLLVKRAIGCCYSPEVVLSKTKNQKLGLEDYRTNKEVAFCCLGRPRDKSAEVHPSVGKLHCNHALTAAMKQSRDSL